MHHSIGLLLPKSCEQCMEPIQSLKVWKSCKDVLLFACYQSVSCSSLRRCIGYSKLYHHKSPMGIIFSLEQPGEYTSRTWGLSWHGILIMKVWKHGRNERHKNRFEESQSCVESEVPSCSTSLRSALFSLFGANWWIHRVPEASLDKETPGVAQPEHGDAADVYSKALGSAYHKMEDPSKDEGSQKMKVLLQLNYAQCKFCLGEYERVRQKSRAVA